MRAEVIRVVPQRACEQAALGFDITTLEFIKAYEELRRLAPKGDLRITLSVDVDDAPDTQT